MRKIHRVAMAAAAAASLVVLSACGSSGDSTDTDGSSGTPTAASYGDCEMFGDAGSIKIDPIKAGVLTVQTTLPSPGWWKGTSPETITGGYEFCLGANIAYRAGLGEVKVQNVSFDGLTAGKTKDFDIAMAQISVTPEREKVLTFSAPYFDSNLGVIARAGEDITADNIRGKKIAVQVGTTAVNWVNDVLRPTGEVKTFDETQAMVNGVAAGRADLAIQDTAIMLGFAANSGGKLEVIGQYESGEKYAAVYPKDSTNVDVLNQAIEAMRADGTLDKLSAKWLGPELGGDPAAVPVWQVQ